MSRTKLFGVCWECMRWGESISEIENKEFKELRCSYGRADSRLYALLGNLLLFGGIGAATCAPRYGRLCCLADLCLEAS